MIHSDFELVELHAVHRIPMAITDAVSFKILVTRDGAGLIRIGRDCSSAASDDRKRCIAYSSGKRGNGATM